MILFALTTKRCIIFPAFRVKVGQKYLDGSLQPSCKACKALGHCKTLWGVVAASTWPKGTVRHTEAARASRREVSPPPSATVEHVLAWLGGRLFFSSGARLPMQYCDRTRPTPGAASPPPPFPSREAVARNRGGGKAAGWGPLPRHCDGAGSSKGTVGSEDHPDKPEAPVESAFSALRIEGFQDLFPSQHPLPAGTPPGSFRTPLVTSRGHFGWK